MGCVKSKRSDSALQNANSSQQKLEGKAKGTKGEKVFLVHAETDAETDGGDGASPQVNPVLLDFAQKLSEEIVARAVQQWAEVEHRYSDIPYIECDVP
ncbi:small membrane A-kinase anchor protein [Genypterus blacodes]|uniref:small membrane A-kinase anchor protein n=1 Tax=Genypterus blacodes TaxID=154954 RepID=UPI003F7612D2